jgi:hypothetical protein
MTFGPQRLPLDPLLDCLRGQTEICGCGRDIDPTQPVGVGLVMGLAFRHLLLLVVTHRRMCLQLVNEHSDLMAAAQRRGTCGVHSEPERGG